jgi:hypothetical protein
MVVARGFLKAARLCIAAYIGHEVVVVQDINRNVGGRQEVNFLDKTQGLLQKKKEKKREPQDASAHLQKSLRTCMLELFLPLSDPFHGKHLVLIIIIICVGLVGITFSLLESDIDVDSDDDYDAEHED